MKKCEVCGIESQDSMCETCNVFMTGIERNNESELIYLRKSLTKFQKLYKQVSKERDILIHRILKFNRPFCPHSTEEMTNIPKTHPELIEHCKEIGNCHNCWYNWIKKEAEECNKKIYVHCPHRCIINQKFIDK